MLQIMQPLRDEHAELMPRLGLLRMAAEAVDGPSRAALDELLRDAVAFLQQDLLPHAQVEEKTVYPAVERILGERATLTMTLDHLEIKRMTDELAALSRHLELGKLAPHDARELRRLLYGIYAMLRLHFFKEETAFLPLLEERLTPGEAEALLQQMGQLAAEAKAAAAAPATPRG
jgi:iron-sulfur cluster repair protein YtfE (RIC family)